MAEFNQEPTTDSNGREKAVAYLNVYIKNKHDDNRRLGTFGIPLLASNKLHMNIVNQMKANPDYEFNLVGICNPATGSMSDKDAELDFV
jgi:hypothetical protein